MKKAYVSGVKIQTNEKSLLGREIDGLFFFLK